VSALGHCQHCPGDCIPRGDWDHWSRTYAVDASGWAESSSAWKSGHCPACAEAERIAVAIWSAAADRRVASMGLTASVEAAYSEAIKIARGDQ
jgi:hypothetical protein